jgi:hypothetical protein
MSKRALLLRTTHYMFRLLIKPSSGVSKHRILKVAVTDPLLKLIKLTTYVADGHYGHIYRFYKLYQRNIPKNIITLYFNLSTIVLSLSKGNIKVLVVISDS